MFPAKKKNNKINISVKVMNTGHTSASRILFTVIHFVCVCNLWYCVRRRVHELSEVHHTLALVLGDVDALDGREARVGVSEVLQLQLPVGES